ncbi:unnamed protein product [Rotaria magnacalcarata]|uniref:Uncharacterized protein n=1 Tax=Rotaria magnacalcarata TaxID=392030 RepID=A0A819UVM5_9BILA|nr:unnamed protein product [Rotaria magnacalcarata]CAF4094720.1 unnamed protein product [Rotaria magnacalcarata]
MAMNNKNEAVICDVNEIIRPESVRHIDPNILQSSLLKIEDNLTDYIIVLVDENLKLNDCQTLLVHIQKNMDKNVHNFDNIESCLAFIQANNDFKIFLIISGTLGEMYCNQLVSICQIECIYVFCRLHSKHIVWAHKIRKIRDVFEDKTELLTLIYHDIKEFASRWLFIDENTFEKTSPANTRLYHLFIRILIERPQPSDAWVKMLDECRLFYRRSTGMLKKIDDFEKKYTPEKAIDYYTQNSFPYRIINRALRTLNIDIITKFQPYISDLSKQLDKFYWRSTRIHRKQESIRPIRVAYRGQYMRKIELEKLSERCRSHDSLVFLNMFGSASLDPEVALMFIEGNQRGRIPCLIEIVIFYHYGASSRLPYSCPQRFVDITTHSMTVDEKEVLFNLGSVFRVKYIGKKTKQRHWIPIILELFVDEIKSGSNWNFLSSQLRHETDDMKEELFDFMKKYAERTNEIDWSKWWSQLEKTYGSRKRDNEPLVVTMYECLGDPESNNKAIELRKQSFANNNRFEFPSEHDRFLFVLDEIKYGVPTRTVALYEWFNENSSLPMNLHLHDPNIMIKLFLRVGDAYSHLHVSNTNALECYHKALDLAQTNAEYQTVHKIQQKITKLTNHMVSEATYRSSQVKENKQTTISYQRIDQKIPLKDILQYEIEHDQWSTFWMFDRISRKANLNRSIRNRLQHLKLYLREREKAIDRYDLGIPLGVVPNQLQSNQWVSEIYSFFFLAVQSYLYEDINNKGNYTLNLWRYEKFMFEWLSLNDIKRMLKSHLHTEPITTELL